MGRVHCGVCGRVGCNDDPCVPEVYCKCECGGNIEIFKGYDSDSYECDTCDNELEIPKYN